MVLAPTQREAEEQAVRDAPQMRVLRSREINLGGPAAMLGRDLGGHWAVVVVPDLTMAADPARLTTGELLQFPCPACKGTIDLTLAAPAFPPQRSTDSARTAVLLSPGRSALWSGRCWGRPVPRRPVHFRPPIPEWVSENLGIKDMPGRGRQRIPRAQPAPANVTVPNGKTVGATLRHLHCVPRLTKTAYESHDDPDTPRCDCRIPRAAR
jgi:hypothetical protein